MHLQLSRKARDRKSGKFYQHPFIVFPSNECYGKAAHLLYDGARSLSEPLTFYIPCAVPESFVRGGPTLTLCVCGGGGGGEEPIPLYNKRATIGRQRNVI